ncbi:arginase, partial [candidate division GN15 bacterium]|nr:arginase [candidate division GN15 bacterium]
PRRPDYSDPRLGHVIGPGWPDYEHADIIIVGCPQDHGVLRNSGRAGANEAPNAIRRALYTFPSPSERAGERICDLGDIMVQPTLEDTHRIHQRIVRRILEDGKRAIILGGGNDISYPDVSALHDVTPDLLAFNIDSHFDVRPSDERTSGTPYRQLLDEGKLAPDRFYEIGCKAEVNAIEHERYLQEQGIAVFWLSDLRRQGIEPLLHELLQRHDASAVFWGFDMDVVRTSDAPGVSASYPIGLSAEEICTIADIAGRDSRSKIIEISEVNPRHDIDNRTARLTAQLLARALRAMLA